MRLRDYVWKSTLCIGIALMLYALVNMISIGVQFLHGLSVNLAAINPAVSESNRDRWEQVNPDIVGWLTVYGTGIDYPVMQDRALREDFLQNGRYTFEYPGKEEDYLKILYKYLYCDYLGNPSNIGSIMLDAVYDINNDYVVIYGHNANQSGVLFSDLKSFEERSFFDEHKTANLYTAADTNTMDLLMVSKISGYSSDVYGWDGLREGEFDIPAMLQYLSENRINGSVVPHDRYVLLSTCYEDRDDEERLVLLYGVNNAA